MVPSAHVLEIVFPDHDRRSLAGDMTIGRDPGNSLRFADPSVSHCKARIRVHEGPRIRLGNVYSLPRSPK